MQADEMVLNLRTTHLRSLMLNKTHLIELITLADTALIIAAGVEKVVSRDEARVMVGLHSSGQIVVNAKAICLGPIESDCGVRNTVCE